MNRLTVTVLVDNPSWIQSWAEMFIAEMIESGHDAALATCAEMIEPGDICFMLGCTQLLDTQFLLLNQHNLVVHESELPQGRGFAPMTWQILEGKNSIPICLLEAEIEADAGVVYYRDTIELQGTELSHQWRGLQGVKTLELCRRFIDDYLRAQESGHSLQGTPQEGRASHYSKRRPSDSELCIDDSIRTLFPLLRVVDNKNYPAFFRHQGEVYKIEISRLDTDIEPSHTSDSVESS